MKPFNQENYPTVIQHYKKIVCNALDLTSINTESLITLIKEYIKQRFKISISINEFGISDNDESICMLLETYEVLYMDGNLYFRTIVSYHQFIDLFTNAATIRNNALRDLYINNRIN